uniref:ATP synthase complex subunit 8 n=1 Tax=Chlorops oryzae TaxID=1046848 RepID=A0A8A5M6U3_9MUSC|nr:ATP synthetase F0 subunit 8 [Chlorops oryzae]QTF87839.1 ATP synthetase F0 subunit 8 [Chlorops oryzae]
MPQMAPINWLFLFILFSLIFLMFNMMNYFLMLPMSPKMKMKKIFFYKSLNWKW